MLRVAALILYPIKSLGGIDLTESAVEPRGLRDDRRWMLVDEDGIFLSQRTFPAMSQFRVEVVAEGYRVQAPDGTALTVRREPEGPRVSVRVWQHEGEAVRVSPEADSWFSDRLGRSARLVWMPDDAVRPTAAEFSQPGDQVGFADAFPVLVAGASSLEDLNARLETPIPMRRFRPNVIVEGSVPYAEDGWSKFRIRDLEFRYAKRCGRCSVTTIDLETAETGTEPLATLATYRRHGNTVAFGSYYIPEGTGRIAIGDVLEGVEEKAPGRTGPKDSSGPSA